jgi:hypothetical protein
MSIRELQKPLVLMHVCRFYPVKFRGRVAVFECRSFHYDHITTLACGQILTQIVFPLNYQVYLESAFWVRPEHMHLAFVKRPLKMNTP